MGGVRQVQNRNLRANGIYGQQVTLATNVGHRNHNAGLRLLGFDPRLETSDQRKHCHTTPKRQLTARSHPLSGHIDLQALWPWPEVGLLAG